MAYNQYKGNKDYEKIQDKISEYDDVGATDINMNPSFYVHKCILKAQDILGQDITDSGQLKLNFIKFRIMIEHLESLCRAGKMLDDEYQKKIEEYKLTKDYTEEKEEHIKNVRLCNKKLEYIMREVFKNQTVTEALFL